MSKRILLPSAVALACVAVATTVALAQAPAAPGAGGGRGGAAGGAGAGAAGAAARGPAAPTQPAPGVEPAAPGVVRAEFPPVSPGVPAGYENITAMGPLPNQGHIPFVLPKDIPWSGQYGVEQTYDILGHQNSPGPYMQLLRWFPGHSTTPHYHEKERYIVVLSGTWWTSASSVYDPDHMTYPLPPGTVVRDTACTIHWDGSRTGESGPTTLLIYGEGPSGNIGVDENGVRTPPRGGGGGAGRGGAAGAAPGAAPAAPPPAPVLTAEQQACAAHAQATSVALRAPGGSPAPAAAPAAGGGRGGGGRGGQ